MLLQSEAESARLEELYSLEILDTDPEEDFNALVKLAGKLCQVPISLVSFVDADRQWFKAKVGLDVSETPREWSFCSHAIQGTKIFVVEDASRDSRFSQNPLVLGKPWIKFYAGVPLISDSGNAMGTLCIIDRQSRSLNEEDEQNLNLLANQAKALLRLRENVFSLKKSEAELKNSLGLVTEQNKKLLSFSYVVSHNLRAHSSNIRAILGYIEDSDSEEEKEEMMGHLREISLGLDESILNLNQIISIQRNANIVLKPLNPFRFVAHAETILGKSISEKAGQIMNEIDPGLEISFNHEYLENIFLNLISNSLRFSKPEIPPRITFTSHRTPGFIVISVRDNGIGINLEKYKSKIFGMYSTLGTNREGKGLGLFIVKNQMEALNGKVTVESSQGKGTVFNLFFNDAN